MGGDREADDGGRPSSGSRDRCAQEGDLGGGAAARTGAWSARGDRAEEKAAIAVGHTLLSIAWAVMRYDSDYTDAGAGYYERRDQRNREHLVRYHQNVLARLGLQVTITQPGDGAPPPPDNPGQAA